VTGRTADLLRHGEDRRFDPRDVANSPQPQCERPFPAHASCHGVGRAPPTGGSQGQTCRAVRTRPRADCRCNGDANSAPPGGRSVRCSSSPTPRTTTKTRLLCGQRSRAGESVGSMGEEHSARMSAVLLVVVRRGRGLPTIRDARFHVRSERLTNASPNARLSHGSAGRPPRADRAWSSPGRCTANEPSRPEGPFVAVS
jgi:hypothetical protein